MADKPVRLERSMSQTVIGATLAPLDLVVIKQTMKHLIAFTFFVLGLISAAQADQPLSSNETLLKIFAARGFDVSGLTLPDTETLFPYERLKSVHFQSLAKFNWFPEGPTYRANDDNYFFSGNHALTRVDSGGQLHEILAEPGGGGTHILPDGSVLVVGHVGLRRLLPDGRVALLADGKVTGPGNDLSVGIHGEIYFSVPSKGIYRLTPGEAGRLHRVSEQGLQRIGGRSIRSFSLCRW